VILIDANTFMYAAGRESPQRLPCKRFLERTVAGSIQILAITEGSLREARALLEDNPSLSTRNGVHLGVMREHVRRRGRRSHGGGGAEAAGLVSSWKGTKRGAES
jgi:hypothetical protein